MKKQSYAVIMTILVGSFALRLPAQSRYSIADLGTFGGTETYALGINGYGQVVGYGKAAASTANHAFVYSNGILSDLATLGGSSAVAYGINDSGMIVGQSTIDGESGT